MNHKSYQAWMRFMPVKDEMNARMEIEDLLADAHDTLFELYDILRDVSIAMSKLQPQG